MRGMVSRRDICSTLLAWSVLATCRKSAHSSLLALLTERSYHSARDRLGCTVPDLRRVESTFVVNYDSSDGQISCSHDGSLEHNEGAPLAETHALADFSSSATDWSDMVELGIGFGASAPMADNDFLAGTMDAMETGASCLPGASSDHMHESQSGSLGGETCYGIQPSHCDQSLSTTDYSSLTGSFKDAERWQGLQSLGIELYPAVQGAF
jgi:hypothetical protein